MEKYVKGGQEVVEGQISFKIDDRQYQTNLSKEKVDLQRYEELWQPNAISEKTLANQRATVKSQEEVAAQEASLQKARDDKNICDFRGKKNSWTRILKFY